MARRKIEGEKHDPFTRRKTMPVIAQMKKEDREMTSELLQELEEKAKVGIQMDGFQHHFFPVLLYSYLYSSSLFQAAAAVAAESTKAKAEEEEKKENRPLDDLFSAHNFDITIDLDVSSPNNATNVNLKPVVHTKKDNGPKKSLNLADYKKKRGLI